MRLRSLLMLALLTTAACLALPGCGEIATPALAASSDAEPVHAGLETDLIVWAPTGNIQLRGQVTRDSQVYRVVLKDGRSVAVPIGMALVASPGLFTLKGQQPQIAGTPPATAVPSTAAPDIPPPN